MLSYLLNIPSADDFWALEDVSFAVKPGEILGIIGQNGAGKSTILKILAQVTQPTAGKVALRGKIGALIEVGTGLHPELTGKENIYLYGAIMGMSGKEMKKKFNEIVEFTGLQDFLTTPLKFYSTGMFLRLGFSVTVHANPEILLVDEILAVGDFPFQSSCLKKIEELKNNGTAIVFISHNLNMVRNLCEHSLLLARGKIITSGASEDVVNKYLKIFTDEEASRYVRYGIGEVKIQRVEIFDANGNLTSKITIGHTLKIRVNYSVLSQNLLRLNIGIGIYSIIDHTYLASINTKVDNYHWNPARRHVDLFIHNVNLLKGEYYINVVAFNDIEALPYDFWGQAATFHITADGPYRGLISFDHQWD